MSVLEEIDHRLKLIEETTQGICMEFLKLNSKDVDKDLKQEIFINTSEVERLLNITRPIILKLTKDGLINTYDNPAAENNKFILSEILWLQNQRYTFLTPIAVKMLLEKKRRESPKRLI